MTFFNYIFLNRKQSHAVKMHSYKPICLQVNLCFVNVFAAFMQILVLSILLCYTDSVVN